MRLPDGLTRPLSSGAFRFALAMALVFAAGSAALLFIVDRAVDHYVADAVADAVSSEVAILVGEDRELGHTALVDAIGRHERAVRERHLRYLLVGPAGQRLAGTLPSAMARPGWHRWRLRQCPKAGCVVPLLVEGVPLGGGRLLVVASDTSDLMQLRHRVSGFTAVTGIALALVVLVGGVVTGGLFLRRLDRVNRSIDRIVDGRFAERLPRIGMGPEFDRLSANLNAMLDRIETLMEGLRQVSTDIAHDLRTPLARLRQRLENLRDDAPQSIASRLDDVLVEIDGLLAVFAALLRIGAMESGAARALFAPVDLARLLSLLVEAYRPELEDRGHLLVAVIADECMVVGDKELVGQAVANLLENAMRHTKAGSRIALALRCDHGGAVIVVEDDGPGIPRHERERVLRRFYRLDRSRSTPGAGLGLPLAAAVASLHGGTITLADAEPGLRVALSLPVT